MYKRRKITVEINHQYPNTTIQRRIDFLYAPNAVGAVLRHARDRALILYINATIISDGDSISARVINDNNVTLPNLPEMPRPHFY